MRWRSWPLGRAGLVALLAMALGVGYFVVGRAIAPPATYSSPGVIQPGTQPGSIPSADDNSQTSKPEYVTLEVPGEAVMQNGTLELSGTGFSPGESVIVSASEGEAGKLKAVATITADAQGKIEQKVTLPEWLTSGPHSLQVTGKDSGRQAQATLYIRANKPWINLASYSVQPTQKLGFVAGGFQPGEDVSIYLEQGQSIPDRPSTRPLLTIKADKAGNLMWTEVQVPLMKPGATAMIVRGKASGLQIGQTVTVEAMHPLLELSPWSGPPGAEINLNGRGFLPGERVSVFVGNGNQPATTFQADQYGNYWGVGPVHIPQDVTHGKLDIKLLGEKSGATVTQQFAVVAPHPWAELNTYSGPSGTPVLVSGGGFAAKERVSIHIGSAGSPIVAEGETDSNGKLWSAGPATVPEGSSKSVTFVVVGESSGAQASVIFQVVDLFSGSGEPGSN